MSNNANINNDELEIHQLPEVSTLQAGMMVAVDSQPTGTKSFNLTNALEGKVGAPATTPAEGQVLTFDGSANTWANPPEGVYVLNYSEVTQLSDIDIARAKSQPTYIRIDDTDITISVPYHYGTTPLPTRSITLKVGTLLKLTHINSSVQFFFSTVYHDGFYGSNPPVGSYGTFFPVLEIYNAGSLVKGWSVSGEVMDGNMYGGMPIPFTKYYINSRSPGQISNANARKNGMEMEFQWNGNFRTQYLPPAEIQDHDFATDETPEQIQFMGWGATSNRAGYKTINEVPTSAAGDSGKVLTVAANGTPGWGNAIGFIKNVGALTDAATITASNLNNGFATLSTSQSALTIIDVVGTDEIVNFAIEITPSVNCTLTIQKQIGSGTPVTLKHAVSAGNELEAGKTYQVTAVGTCWTLAEFEA